MTTTIEENICPKCGKDLIKGASREPYTEWEFCRASDCDYDSRNQEQITLTYENLPGIELQYNITQGKVWINYMGVCITRLKGVKEGQVALAKESTLLLDIILPE
jgi:hypothetical protein